MVDKVTKKIILDLRGMNTEQRNQLKGRIGKYVVDAITDDCSFTRSPVTGLPFKKLDKEYAKAKRKKGQPSIPNLQLTDKMLAHLRFTTNRDGLEVGIFAKKQALKADNHCKFSSESMTTAVPRRAFIPKEEERFRPEIRKTVKEINKEFRKNLGLKINGFDYE